jgi:phage terminase large subunit
MQIELDYLPFDHQSDFHRCDKRFRLVVGGRRAGKSKSVFQDMLLHCLTTPGALAWWVAPTYSEAREIGYEEFLSYFEALSPAIKNVHHSLMRVEFKNSAKIYFKGADRQDSLRGRGLSYLAIDEAAFIKEETWKKVLRPSLSDKKGKAVLISTADGRNWFCDQYTWSSHSSRKAWQTFKWPSSVNPMMTEEELADAREQLSSSDFRQEYLAEFITKAGQVYDDFGEKNIIDTFHYDQQIYDIYIGLDFGFANPSAAALMAHNRLNNHVIQFAEVQKERLTMEELQEKIESQLIAHDISPKLVSTIYTDPAGNAEEITSGISPVDFLRKTYNVVNRGTSIAPGLTLVRSYILNANGKRRFFIHKNCKHTIKSLFGYQYKFKQNNKTIDEEPDKDGVHDHMCDAIRYFFVNKFDNAKWITDTLVDKSYLHEDKHHVTIKRCATCRRPFSSVTPKTQQPFLCKECTDNAS